MSNEEDPSKRRPYEVGYGKPPKAHQFKSTNGASADGKGKSSKTRKRTKDEPEQVDLGAILSLPVSVKRNGRTEKMATFEALLRIQAEAAVKHGNLGAINAVLDLATEWGLIQQPQPAVTGGVLRVPITCAADLDRFIDHFCPKLDADAVKPEDSHE